MSPKTLLILLFIGPLLVGTNMVLDASAQPGNRGRGPGGARGQEPRGERQAPALPDSMQIVQIVERLAENLSLTSEQKVRVSELHFAHFTQVQEAMGQQSRDRAAAREKMDALRSEFEESVLAELNDEQGVKFKKIMEEHRTRSRPPRQRRQ